MTKLSNIEKVFGNKTVECKDYQASACIVKDSMIHFTKSEAKNIVLCMTLTSKYTDKKGKHYLTVLLKYQDASLKRKNECLLKQIRLDRSCDYAEEKLHINPNMLFIFKRQYEDGEPFTCIAFPKEAILKKAPKSEKLPWLSDEESNSEVPF